MALKLINCSAFYYGVPVPLPVVPGFVTVAEEGQWLFARDRVGKLFFLGENKRKTAWVLTPRTEDGRACTDHRIQIPK